MALFLSKRFSQQNETIFCHINVQVCVAIWLWGLGPPGRLVSRPFSSQRKNISSMVSKSQVVNNCFNSFQTSVFAMGSCEIILWSSTATLIIHISLPSTATVVWSRVWSGDSWSRGVGVPCQILLLCGPAH